MEPTAQDHVQAAEKETPPPPWETCSRVHPKSVLMSEGTTCFAFCKHCLIFCSWALLKRARLYLLCTLPSVIYIHYQDLPVPFSRLHSSAQSVSPFPSSLSWPFVGLLLCVHLSRVLESLELDTSLQAWPHQC